MSVLAVVITALPVESEAVLAELEAVETQIHPSGTVYSVGRLRNVPGVEIGHVEVGMGGERTAQHVERAVEFLAPRALLFVGVAGGVKDCQVGDVVVATKTYQYEYGVDGAIFKPRPQTYAPSHLMEQLARANVRDFDGHALLGPIATGAKVIHSHESATAELLSASYSDTLAVDMEGHALYAAAAALMGVHALVVRGISDLLDGKATTDESGSQQMASAAAARFAIAIINDLAAALNAGVPHVSVNRLPSDDAEVIGRHDVLSTLHKAVADPLIHIVSMTAWAGTGKTAIADAWCRELRSECLSPDGYLFTWSFYNQGTSDARASSDDFFVALLEFAGVAAPDRISPWRRVEMATTFCRQREVVLVLDGLEPLQQPDGIELGRIVDGPLSAFFRELALECNGTILVTSRVSIGGLRHEHHYPLELQNLSPPAAVATLEYYGLHSDVATLNAIVEVVEGHCLSLRLIARFFSVCSPTTSRAEAIDALRALRQLPRKVERILNWYENFLLGTPQHDVLRSLGLLDRPAPIGAIYAVHAPPPLGAINPNTAMRSSEELAFAVRELQHLGLIRVDEQSGDTVVDAHPLIRESYSRRLESEDYDAWQAAHGRLMAYFDSAVPRPADTGDELTTLYRATRHGTLAGRGRDVVTHILRPKVQQGERSFATKVVQAANADLAALAPFFSADWTEVILDIDPDDERWLRGLVIYDLRVLGKVSLSLALCQRLLSLVAVNESKIRSVVAANAAHLSLLAGNIASSVELAKEAVSASGALAPGSAERIAARRGLSNALFFAGQMSEAANLASPDETVGNPVRSEYPAFLSPVGFRYGTMLVAAGEQLILHGDIKRGCKILQDGIARFSEARIWLSGERGYSLAAGLVLLVLARLSSTIAFAGKVPAQDPWGLFEEADAELRSAATQDLVICSRLYGGRILSDMGSPMEGLVRIRDASRLAREFELPLYEITALVEEGISHRLAGEQSTANDIWERAEQEARAQGFGLETTRLRDLRTSSIWAV